MTTDAYETWWTQAGRSLRWALLKEAKVDDLGHLPYPKRPLSLSGWQDLPEFIKKKLRTVLKRWGLNPQKGDPDA